MGCKSSKNGLNNNVLPVEIADSDGNVVESEDIFDKKQVEMIRNELQNRPQHFILNNLLMLIQIFKNFETDLYDFSNSATPKEEIDLNSLLVNELKQCIIPYTLIEKIQKNILLHQYNDQNEESFDSLEAKTYYVVNNNIEVASSQDLIYTPLDVPGCQVVVEDIKETESAISSRKKGFIRLKVTQNSLKHRNSLLTKQKSVQIPVSEDKRSSDIYQAITDFNTPKSLEIVENVRHRDSLPDICFETRVIDEDLMQEEEEEEEEKEDDDDDDEEEDDEDNSSSNKKNTEKEIEVTYLSSKGFMNYFQNEIFPNSTSKLMNFTENDIKKAVSIPGIIFCNKDNKSNKISCKIIPCVAIDWPLQATEYINRKTRNRIIDKWKGTVYQWPTKDMVTDLKALNCVAIPKGYTYKRMNEIENHDVNIEWEIHFPKAERYLEARMSHQQVRCLTFLLILYKIYIEPITTNHGILIEHLKTHIFHECETDAKNWPESRLGTKLLKVIENFNNGMSIGKIHHYFIREKNIFESIQSKYLQFAHEKFNDISRYPAMHFILALKSIRYIRKDFYPFPDLDKLVHILTKSEKKLFSPNMNLTRGPTVLPQPKTDIRKSVHEIGYKPPKKPAKITNLKRKQQREEQRRKQFLENKKKSEVQTSVNNKSNETSINLKWHKDTLYNFQQVELLQYFIVHFIEIAKKSKQIGPQSQTLSYLKQASYLTTILKDSMEYHEDVKKFDKTINHLTEAIENSNIEEVQIAPPTPQRNQPFFPTTSKFVKRNQLAQSNSVHYDENKKNQTKEKYENVKIARPKSVGFNFDNLIINDSNI